MTHPNDAVTAWEVEAERRREILLGDAPRVSRRVDAGVAEDHVKRSSSGRSAGRWLDAIATLLGGAPAVKPGR
jgi:hypothetical protein